MKQKKLPELRDFQYRSLFLIVLYLILTTIALEQLITVDKGNNKITELRTILQRGSPNS